MPVDSTKPSKRVPRKLTEAEQADLEVKRLKGEASCAECHRLKLKCDKKVPCASCSRRGCESICPSGVLSAGHGTRYILADTERLHQKISQMSTRIRQLEDALVILHAAVSDQPHPLLTNDLLKIKFGCEVSEDKESNPEVTQHLDAFGTLTMSDAGEVKYFGRSAGSETLMVVEDDDLDDEDEEPPTTVTSRLPSLLPFAFNDDSCETLDTLLSSLPCEKRAIELCESYLNHASNFFRPIKRDELLDSFLPSIYTFVDDPQADYLSLDLPSPKPNRNKVTLEPKRNTPHALSSLFFLFALGALLDLDLRPYNSEAERYYGLGCAALSQHAIFDSPQLDTVQALGLMATYQCLGGKKYSRSSAWCIMAFAVKVAQSIGLHRDSSRWNMDAKLVEKRRILFWEVFSADLSHSLALGRPPAMSLSYVDCEFPIDEEASLSNNGEIQHGFWRMKYTFSRDMFLGVADATLTAKSPSYATILELDRKVREFSFPTSVKQQASRERDGDEKYFSSSASLQSFYASQYRSVTMLYLHRSFFAQAMLDNPSNPLLSPFAASFLAANSCASTIIQASECQFDRCVAMGTRVWFLLYQTFSAAIVVGSIVTRSPNSSLASGALRDLNTAINLFEMAATQSHWAKVVVGILNKLKDKALTSYQKCSQHLVGSRVAPSNLGSPASFSPSEPSGSPLVVQTLYLPKGVRPNVIDESDELAIFGGQVRVVARKHRGRRRTLATPANRGCPPSSDLPASPTSRDMEIDVDPGVRPEIAFVSDIRTESRAMTTNQEGVDQNGAGKGVSSSTTSCSSGVLHSQSVSAATKAGVNSTAHREPGPTIGGHIDSALNAVPSFKPAVILGLPFQSNSTHPRPSQNPPLNYGRSARETGREWSLDPDGLPKVDTSFGWVPPRMSLSGFGQTIQNQPTPAAADTEHQSSPTQLHPQPQSLLPSSTADASLSTSTMITNDDDHVIMMELGLMTDSNIDSSWLSFVQDSGIMVRSGET